MISKLYEVGESVPMHQFLRAGLESLGYTFVDELEGTEALIFSPLTTSDALTSEKHDPTLQWIHSLRNLPNPIQKVIFLSSASIYGEGDYTCGDCGPIINPARTHKQLESKRWELICPICGEMLMPLALKESSKTEPKTSYGMALLNYENALNQIQSALSCSITKLRLFHPYWPTASFLEPTTPSVITTFTQNLLSNQSPFLYEDGYQMRDFTHGQDILQAVDRVLKAPHLEANTYNVGSGQRITIQELAAYLQEFLGKEDVSYILSETFRPEDIRHSFADISLAQKVLGYKPQYPIIKGVEDFTRQMSQTAASGVKI